MAEAGAAAGRRPALVEPHPGLRPMELVCEKHHEVMDSATAYCRHLSEYCKFRTACLINFMSKENRPPAANGQGTGQEATPLKDQP